MNHLQTIKILGINFFSGTSKQVVETLKTGGLLVVPAAPALVNIKEDLEYYQALLNADIVIPDSGYMALIWNMTNKKRINRISGLRFLIDFFADDDVKATEGIMLIDPRPNEAQANMSYLNSIGFTIAPDASYLAPMYDKNNVTDEKLLKLIEQRKPKYVIINLGGGTQEKLGSYLKNNLNYKPALICTGAAIAFLTGQQARIPDWADQYFMGWLFRCLGNPKLYITRYLKAFKLLPFLIKYSSKMPS